MVDAFRDPRLQPLRLISGLVLLAFALAHFANHAVGLISLDAMNQVQDWRLMITHTTPARLILLMAVLVHVILGLGKFASRRTLHMPFWEWLQISSGILVPVLLIPHVVAITYFAEMTDFFYSYTSVTFQLWPTQAAWQSALLLIVWLHGCIGLHFWLRQKPWYRRAQPLLFAVAVTLPLLALTGFLSAAREAHAALADASALAKARVDLGWPGEPVISAMHRWRDVSWQIYAGMVGLMVATYCGRRMIVRAAPAFAVTYAGGPAVRAALGSSLLEISRIHGIPHASVCGGRARCSTCRVRIDHTASALAPPDAVELLTLHRIGAPQNVRLACQLRPTTDIGVTRLVTPSSNAVARINPGATHADGVEKQVAILFLDVRGFTKMSEHRLPFDIVFLLNQFFAAVGEAIRGENGWIDKYMGDGLMAVFGHETDVTVGCRQALAAARAIDLALDGLNHRLAAEIADGIKIGIGIHAGPVVIGRIGDTTTAALTVVGRTVNEASRLEALTKEKSCQLIVSRTVADHAGLALTTFARETIDVRGSDARIDIVIIQAARDVPPNQARKAVTEAVSA